MFEKITEYGVGFAAEHPRVKNFPFRPLGKSCHAVAEVTRILAFYEHACRTQSVPFSPMSRTSHACAENSTLRECEGGAKGVGTKVRSFFGFLV